MVDDRMIILNTPSLKHPLTLKSSTDTIGRENVCVCVCVWTDGCDYNSPPPAPERTDPP